MKENKMSIYKSYKSGGKIKSLVETNGVRKTFTALKRKLTGSMVRIKHNRIQMLDKKTKTWIYQS
jgi:hypothetical protein